MEHFKKFKHSAINTLFIYVMLLTLIITSTPSCSDNKSEGTKGATENNNTNDQDVEKKDKQFLVDAAEINLEEIKLGQLAQQNSTTPNVKELGKMMETEHIKCLNDLKVLAEKKSIIIPTSITEEGEEAYEKLIGISGAEFDKKYCAMMVDGHKNAISAFEKATTDSNDPDIRAWASETLPSLRKHLDHALNCQKNCSKM
jgi:putative membrane protein